MQVNRRTNLFLGLVIVAASVLFLLYRLESFPAGFQDILNRAWPVLLVLIGLMVLLRERIPFSGLLSIIISGVLAVGVVSLGYSNRESEQRDDQEIALDQVISPETALLALNIEVLETELEIRANEAGESGINGVFSGSLSSEVSFDCSDSEVAGGNITTCNFIETKPEQYPPLDAVGHGRLEVRVPADVPVVIAFSGVDGSATFDLNATQLERLDVDLAAGNVLFTVPAYQPQSPTAISDPGEIIVQNGNLAMVVPDAINARVVFDRRGNNINPEFHTSYIEQRDGVDGVLRRDNETGDINLEFDVVIPNGLLRLDVSGG